MVHFIPSIIILLLPLAIGVYYWIRNAEKRKQLLLDHKKEIGAIQKKFYAAIRMRFFRTPLIVRTTKEKAYYNKLIVHYKNSTRNVELISPILGETNLSYHARKNNYIDKYCIDNLEAIKQGQEAYTKYFEKIREKGLLKYLKTPFNSEESKQYIYSEIDFLLKHPKAAYGNYKKPSNVVEFQ